MNEPRKDQSPEPAQTGADEDAAEAHSDPLHLTEGADPHGEVPVGPQPDVPLLSGSDEGR